jgi:hypothetical protein
MSGKNVDLFLQMRKEVLSVKTGILTVLAKSQSYLVVEGLETKVS